MVNLSNLRQNKQDQQGTAGLDSSEVSALSGGGVEVFDTIDSLPSTGLTTGSKALVNSLDRLYVSDGSGWYNLELATGFTPRWDSGGEPDATYSIADSATPLIVTARAVDSDGTTPINQSFVSDSAQYMTTISNDSSVWTFTPKTKVQIGSAVAAGNLTDSNGDFIYTFKWSDGINVLSKAVTISYRTTASFGYRGTRAWGTGGTRSDVIGGTYAGPVGGGSKDVHYLDIVTRSNSTEIDDLIPYSYSSGLGKNTASTTGSKAIVIGGTASSYRMDDIYTFDTVSLATATSFGSTTSSFEGDQGSGTCNDGYRTVAHMSRDPSNNYSSRYEKLHYITNAQEGNTTEFGELTYDPYIPALTNDATRGIIAGGDVGTYGFSTVNYITIQTVGNATSQGSLNQSGGYRLFSMVSDDTYAVIPFGRVGMPGGSVSNLHYRGMKYLTIQTLGNASSFGTSVKGRNRGAAASDGTTGVMWGGDMLTSANAYNTGSHSLYAEYFTIATPGNSTDFGFKLNNGGEYPAHGSGAAA